MLQVHAPDVAAHRAERLAGLQAEQAFIAPKFFYDALGARLFDAITALPEYTLTRAEAAILGTHRRPLRELLPAADAFALVDLGAGNCAKAAALFDALPLSHYVAADIAAPVLQASLAALQPLHPQLPMIGVCADFTLGVELPLLQRAGWTLRHTLVDSVGDSVREIDNVIYSLGSRTGSEAGYAVFTAHA